MFNKDFSEFVSLLNAHGVEYLVEMVLIQGLPIPFIGLEDFKTNKKATGRLKDLADLESLNQRTGDKSQ